MTQQFFKSQPIAAIGIIAAALAFAALFSKKHPPHKPDETDDAGA